MTTVAPARSSFRALSSSLVALAACACVGLGAGACSGKIGDEPTGPGGANGGASGGGNGGNGGGGSGGGGGIGKSAAPLCSLPGPAPTRRLTRLEYDNTVRDLLGLDLRLAQTDFPADAYKAGFAVGLSVSTLHAEGYMKAAETLAKAADLGKLLDCDVKTGDKPCVERFIASFGARAFRRPLRDAEKTSLLALYDKIAPADGFEAATRVVLQAMLQSPQLLYRIELGDATASGGSGDSSGAQPLTQHELATRIAYLVWRSTPDKALLDAAAAGKLSTSQQIEAQVRRMLSDPRARTALRSFFAQWLKLDHLEEISKDKTLYPAYSTALAHDMRAETERFIDEVVWNGDGSLTTLLSAKYSFINAALAKHYGISGVSGSELRRVDMPAGQRLGLLTHASLMAILASDTQSSPIERGLFIRRRLLCQEPPDPPENLAVTPPEFDPSLSTRERFEQHRKDPMCAGCHKLIDPVGFGFEHYDGIGRYRVMDSGFKVDAAGHIYGTANLDGPFVGAIELSQKLAKSDAVKRCFVRQYFRFTYGRLDEKTDGCAIASAANGFIQSGGDVRELIVQTTLTKIFRYRRGELKDAQ